MDLRIRSGRTLVLLSLLAAGCGEDGASASRTSSPGDDASPGDDDESGEGGDGQAPAPEGGGGAQSNNVDPPSGGGGEPPAADDDVAPTGDDDVAPTEAATTLESITLDDFPHAIDVYATAGAERAIVMLHGGGGTNQLSATDLGLNENDGAPSKSSVDWAWLEEHRMVAVFPQGQAVSGAPNAFTWTNHVMDSGENDVSFLKALARYVRDEYQVSSVYLMGHSNGGMMANRMWCESPGTFDAYVAIAGPASSDYLDSGTPCAPDVVQPYFGIVGDSDVVLGVPGNWDATTWEISPILTAISQDAFVNPTLIGEWTQQQNRIDEMCGDTLSIDDAESDGATDTWSACDGLLKLQRVRGGEHPIDTLEAAAGYRMLDVAEDFFQGL